MDPVVLIFAALASVVAVLLVCVGIRIGKTSARRLTDEGRIEAARELTVAWGQDLRTPLHRVLFRWSGEAAVGWEGSERAMANLEDMKARVLALQGPMIRKARSDAKLSCQFRAAFALQVALDALGWSQRHAAKALGVDLKVITMWLKAAQQPAWVPLALPREGYLAYLDALLEEVPPASKTGTHA